MSVPIETCFSFMQDEFVFIHITLQKSYKLVGYGRTKRIALNMVRKRLGLPKHVKIKI